MKDTIKQIIESNLPEKIEIYPINVEKQDEKWNYLNGFNQALSQINHSKIADEVLKVVGKFLFENLQSNHDECPIKMTCIGYQSCVSDIENLLSNLSPNKENKNK